MKAVWIGLALMIVLSGIGWAVTSGLETTSGESFLSDNQSVRLD